MKDSHNRYLFLNSASSLLLITRLGRGSWFSKRVGSNISPTRWFLSREILWLSLCNCAAMRLAVIIVLKKGDDSSITSLIEYSYNIKERILPVYSACWIPKLVRGASYIFWMGWELSYSGAISALSACLTKTMSILLV